MKTYFLRHGVAVAVTDWEGADEDRPLAPGAAEAVAAMVRALPADFAPARIICSPYRRTRQTADAVASVRKLPISIDDSLAAGASAAAYSALIAAAKEPVLFIGHMPDLLYALIAVCDDASAVGDGLAPGEMIALEEGRLLWRRRAAG